MAKGYSVDSKKRFFAEFIGSFLLVATVVGSGAMAQSLTQDRALQLLINALATVFTLALVIYLFSEISGAHFNPLVTAIEFLSGRLPIKVCPTYLVAQCTGAFLGAVTANLMFGLPAIDPSQHHRDGAGLLLGEVVATAGLILIIRLLSQQSKSAAPIAISAWIGAAYFFTSSTSFANPSVTFARAWTTSFSGISLSSIPLFIAAQVIGAVLGLGLSRIFESQSLRSSHV
jgi:glycerol uptake facilitator-like aquaporin